MRNTILHIILILSLPLFITGCKKTEIEATINTGNIEGKITDNTNAQPIPVAEVKISGSNQIVFSGADGSYKFISLDVKEYQFTVSKQNYVPETKTISVLAGQTTKLDFSLSPFSLTITPTNQIVADTAGTTQFTITSNISWTASIDQSWCTLDKTSGNGNNIITATYQANTTIWERKATLTITGNTLAPVNVTLTQSAPPYVSICNQVWMVKNLDVATYRNGDPIPHVADEATWAALTTGAYCYYNNDSATYAATYGKLYNWHAVNDPRGLAPAGWHVASDAEWDIELTGCLGGPSEAGGKMKAVSDLWQFPNVNATNSSGFTALPGGLLEDTSFGSIGYYGFWWSSTDDASIPSFAIAFGLVSSAPDIIYMGMPKEYGLSVRCIRD